MRSRGKRRIWESLRLFLNTLLISVDVPGSQDYYYTITKSRDRNVTTSKSWRNSFIFLFCMDLDFFLFYWNIHSQPTCNLLADAICFLIKMSMCLIGSMVLLKVSVFPVKTASSQNLPTFFFVWNPYCEFVVERLCFESHPTVVPQVQSELQ